MAFDGNGNYIRIHNWQQDAANLIDISAPEMDAEDNSIAGALNNCVTRDGQGKMGADFTPAADQVYNLGTGGSGANAKRWLSLNGVPIANFLQSTNFGTFTNPITPAETAESVTPAFYIYSASPRVDPRRYGGKGDGTTDDTVANQTAINVALASRGRVVVPEGYLSLTGPLSCTLNGTDSTNVSLAIEGQSQTGSMFIPQAAMASPIFTFASSAPLTPVLQPAQLILENFGVQNQSGAITAGGFGISIQGLGWVRISGVQCRGFDTGLDLLNSLEILIDQQCQFTNNNNGIYSRKVNFAGTLNNLIKVDRCRLAANGNSASGVSGAAVGWGMNMNGGSMLEFSGNDVEQNGTVGNVNTGGLTTGPDIAGNYGYAKVELKTNWFEANRGCGVYIQPPAAGTILFSLKGGHIIATNAGAALNVGASGSPYIGICLIEDCYSPSAGDTWNLYAGSVSLKQTIAAIVNDFSTQRSYTNAFNSSGSMTVGGTSRPVNFTATMAGITGTTSAASTASIEGNLVSAQVPPITGASNSGAMTISGFPASICPASTRYFVISAVDPSNALPFMTQGQLSSAGVLTISGPLAAGAWTTTGSTKGVYGLQLTFPLS